MAKRPHEIDTSVCSTSMKRCGYTVSQKWVIKDYTTILDTVSGNPVLYSEPFGHGSDCPETKWRMKFFPLGLGSEKNEQPSQRKSSLFVELMETSPTPRFVTQCKFLQRDPSPYCFASYLMEPGADYGFKNVSRKILEQITDSSGSLHLWCQLTVAGSGSEVPEFETRTDTVARVDDLEAEQSENLKLSVGVMLSGQKLVDFTIKNGDRSFGVHKVILAAQSEVLIRMFQGEFVEQENNEVEIVEFSSGAIEHFVNFLYAKAIPSEDFANYAEELVALGEKYGVTRLKALSESKIIECLTVENVCQSLALSEMHRADQLHNACLQFIVQHKDEVVRLDAWKALKEAYPKLVVDVLETEWGVAEASEPDQKRAKT